MRRGVVCCALTRAPRVQAIKNNARDVPTLMSLQQNYIGGAGAVALREALEEAYGMTDVEITIKM